MLVALGRLARGWTADQVPWTNVYGLARSLLALGTATTLIFTPTAYLFPPLVGLDAPPYCKGATRLGAFCLLPSTSLEVMRWLAVIALLVVASGWRPRLTAPLHWWIAFSVANNATLIDGGDQVPLVLCTLLLPVALTDRRRWHWSGPPSVALLLSAKSEAARFVALFFWTLARIQVAAIYFYAAIGKFGVEEWVDGTAVYYYFQHPVYGAATDVLWLLRPILKNPIGVATISWGTMVLEYLLSAALFMPKRYWRPLLIAGILLHAGIMVVLGLISFGIGMFGALVVYLRPMEASFEFAPVLRAARRLRRAWLARTGRRGTAYASSSTTAASTDLAA
jgi:antimicrobial peptide system SdpB family protein